MDLNCLQERYKNKTRPSKRNSKKRRVTETILKDIFDLYFNIENPGEPALKVADILDIIKFKHNVELSKATIYRYKKLILENKK